MIRQFIPLLTQGSSAIDGDEPSVAPELQKKLKAKKKRLTEPLLVRIMNTREGLKIGVSCLKHGSAKVGYIFFSLRLLFYVESIPFLMGH